MVGSLGGMRSIGDREKTPGAGEHGADGHGQHRGVAMADTPPVTGIGDALERGQEPLRPLQRDGIHVQDGASSRENRRVELRGQPVLSRPLKRPHPDRVRLVVYFPLVGANSFWHRFG
jgi:hypothetical protein